VPLQAVSDNVNTRRANTTDKDFFITGTVLYCLRPVEWNLPVITLYRSHKGNSCGAFPRGKAEAMPAGMRRSTPESAYGSGVERRPSPVQLFS
jgi:hypothetical protein